MDDQLQTSPNELSTLTIKDLFYKYVRFLPLFILSIALALFVAYVYLRYATFVYSSTGSMVIQDEQSSSGSGDRLDVLLESDSKKNIQNEIEYLSSRQMMSRVVRSLDLNFTYLAKGNIKELNIYKSSPFKVEPFEIYDSSGFVLKIQFESDNAFRVNGSEKLFAFGQVFKNEYGVFRLTRSPNGVIQKEYKVIWSPTGSVAGSLAGNLLISRKQNTDILLLREESNNPQLAADVVNQLMVEYQKATIDDKNATTRNKLVYVDKVLDTVSRQLDSITSIRVAFINQNKLYDPQTQSANYLNRVEVIGKEMLGQQQLLQNANQIETDLLTSSNTLKVPSSLGLSDPTLNNLVNSYNEAQIRRKTLLETAPPGNRTVQAQEEIIGQLQRNILKNLNNIQTSLRTSLGSLQQFSSEAQSHLSVLPAKQQQLNEIDQLLTTKATLFNSLLGKRQDLAITLASTISDINVLQEASVNNAPIKPNRRNIQLLAIVVGLVLPALFIFILEVLNDKVTTRHDIERITSATIIGEVGHSYADETLVVKSTSRGVVAEQFRIIRSNLQYVINHIERPVVLVTSSFSGEGKSFVSTNVGAVMALAGKKTIILEFDIRKPKILSQLHIPRKVGLTNFLLGKVGVQDLPIKVEGYENLYVLSCGPVPPNPSELLLDEKLNELFVYLRQNFDVVIMDTAPVGMVSDAMTLSKFANCTLYIVRQGHTFKKQIGLLEEFHREKKLPRISIILNDVKIRTGYGYYGYGRYGYGYGYGSGYFEDETPPPTQLEKWFGWLDTKKWNKKKRKKSKV